MEYTGFIPIAAIFYAVFHPEEGTKIVYQVPSDAISTGSRDNAESLFNFDTVKNYVIPKAQLCNKLISFKINNYRVIGFPVNIENATYARNTFNFDFCFVFPYDVGDVTPYESPIKRMGTMFKVLEEQSFLLSKLDDSNSFYKHTPETSGPAISAPGHARTTSIKLSSIESLIAQIYSDLNNYCECCIPLDSANSVDIKLFPILPPPVNIKAYQVPIATVKLHTLVDSTSDPAMIQIVPHINGLNSIRRISELSQADYMLTKQCIQHLMHYKCIELIDIFQFSNVYATTNHIGNFLRDDGRMAEECQAYVVTDYGVEQLLSPTAQSQINSVSPGSHSHHYFSSRVSGTTPGTPSHPIKVPSKSTLFALYRKLNQGMTVKEWYLENRHQLESIDVRRFINFGVVRRIIYRVHSFPLLNSITRAIEKDEFYELTESSVRKKSDSAMVVPTPAPKNRTVTFNKPSHKHATQSDSDSVYSSDLDDEDLVEDEEEVLVRKQSTKSSVDESHDGEMRDLFKMLKGFQPFDSICTELQKSRREVEAMVQQFGSYNIANS